MEIVYSSKTLVSIYQSKWYYNPEDQHWHLHLHEKLRSQTKMRAHRHTHETVTGHKMRKADDRSGGDDYDDVDIHSTYSS
jgi:hypothetical protein